jgi:hypothetical protein
MYRFLAPNEEFKVEAAHFEKFLRKKWRKPQVFSDSLRK